MKDTIYTIPVMDAIRENSECPFCSMWASLESNAIEFVMGPSYMERDVRAETDKLGFCGEHLRIMAKSKNSLGLALMLQTHLLRLNKEMHSAAAKGVKAYSKSGFFAKKSSDADSSINILSELIYKQRSQCYVCLKAENMFKQYVDTFFRLWKQDDELMTLILDSNGFCISHFALLLEEGLKKLNSKDFSIFSDSLIKLQLNNLDRLEQEIDWFVKKFDYRFADEPWLNSKDSVQRAIAKIASVSVD